MKIKLLRENFETRKAYFLKAFDRNIEDMSIVSFSGCNFKCLYCKRGCQYIDCYGKPIKTVSVNEKDFFDMIDDSLKQNKTIRLSDGYHTFNELYYHRMLLFSIICNQNKDVAWKSKLHDDGTMFDGYFIVGITTPKGDFTYHYELKDWDMFKVKELETAPKWDGHQPKDIVRLLSI